MKEQTKNQFSWAMIATIFALAWPTMLEQLLQTAVQYIDTMMVGSLGSDATAAVGGTSTVNWLIGSTVSAIGVGFLAYIAQGYGAGEREQLKKASGQAVFAVLTVGLLLTAITLAVSGYVPRWMRMEERLHSVAAQYFFILYTPMLARAATIIFGTLLRAAGDTKTPMYAGLLVNAVNLIGNFFLIYPTRTVVIFEVEFTVIGAGMGVIGAAVASAVAFWLGGIVITVALYRHKLVSPKGYSLRPDAAILKKCFSVALPNALQRFGTSFGYVAFASMINSIGSVATAAHTFANTVESAFYIPGYGMQTAAATLAGNAYGERDGEKLKSLAKMALWIEEVLMILSGVALFLSAPALMRLFSDEEEVIRLGTTVLRMVALSEPFYGFSIIVEGMLHGMGKTFLPFVANIAGMWGVRIVGTFVCTQIFSLGLVSAWGCMILHNLALFCVYCAYYACGRWNPLAKTEKTQSAKA